MREGRRGNGFPFAALRVLRALYVKQSFANPVYFAAHHPGPLDLSLPPRPRGESPPPDTSSQRPAVLHIYLLLSRKIGSNDAPPQPAEEILWDDPQERCGWRRDSWNARLGGRYPGWSLAKLARPEANLLCPFGTRCKLPISTLRARRHTCPLLRDILQTADSHVPEDEASRVSTRFAKLAA